jgi:hypothetical protein
MVKYAEFNRIVPSRYIQANTQMWLLNNYRDQTLANGIHLVTIAGLLHHPRKLAKIYLAVTCDRTRNRVKSPDSPTG